MTDIEAVIIAASVWRLLAQPALDQDTSLEDYTAHLESVLGEVSQIDREGVSECANAILDMAINAGNELALRCDYAIECKRFPYVGTA